MDISNNIQEIGLNEIDFSDTSFLIRPPGNIDQLTDSISSVGLLHPPILRRHGSGCQIVAGRRRLVALQRLGREKVACRVYENENLTDFDALLIAFNENREGFGEMEHAIVLKKLESARGFDPDGENYRASLERLGLPPARKRYERLRALGGLPVEVIDAYYVDDITIEQAHVLAAAERGFASLSLKKVFVPYGFNLNETREAAKELPEIAALQGLTIESVIDGIEKEMGGNKTKARFRNEMKKLRNPILARVERLFKETVKGLSLADRVSLNHSPYFEGDHLEIKFRFESRDELSEALESIEKAGSKGSLDRLLKLVREGDLE